MGEYNSDALGLLVGPKVYTFVTVVLVDYHQSVWVLLVLLQPFYPLVVLGKAVSLYSVCEATKFLQLGLLVILGVLHQSFFDYSALSGQHSSEIS